MRRQCLGDGLLCEDIGKWLVAVLKELPPQKLHLLLNLRLGRMAHPWASLPVMDVVRNTIRAREALFAYVILTKGLAAELSAIRPPRRRILVRLPVRGDRGSGNAAHGDPGRRHRVPPWHPRMNEHAHEKAGGFCVAPNDPWIRHAKGSASDALAPWAELAELRIG